MAAGIMMPEAEIISYILSILALRVRSCRVYPLAQLDRKLHWIEDFLLVVENKKLNNIQILQFTG